jgi:hypothetical protein
MTMIRKFAAVIPAGMLLALAACGSSASSVQVLPRLPSAASVAREVKASGFTDCGSAPGGGVTDSGTAYLNGKRIGIDTFPSARVRDHWKATAGDFGVVVTMQGPTWVVYNAVDQKATRCR